MKTGLRRTTPPPVEVDGMPLWQWLALFAILGTTLAVLGVLAGTIIALHVTGPVR